MEVKKTSAGFVLYREGQILVLKNNFGWGFPKGLVEQGESPMQAAIRETQEETGITPGRATSKPVEYTQLISKDWDTMEPLEHPFLKKVILFFALSPTFDVQLSDEHLEYKWVPREEGVKFLKGLLS